MDIQFAAVRARINDNGATLRPAARLFRYYDKSNSLRTNQRPHRDRSGPGAHINPDLRAAGAAGNAGADDDLFGAGRPDGSSAAGDRPCAFCPRLGNGACCRGDDHRNSRTGEQREGQGRQGKAGNWRYQASAGRAAAGQAHRHPNRQCAASPCSGSRRAGASYARCCKSPHAGA